jgi:hypothetical protein
VVRVVRAAVSGFGTEITDVACESNVANAKSYSQ